MIVFIGRDALTVQELSQSLLQLASGEQLQVTDGFRAGASRARSHRPSRWGSRSRSGWASRSASSARDARAGRRPNLRPRRSSLRPGAPA
jgi:hypothetical protein